jgi:hypothetical protein
MNTAKYGVWLVNQYNYNEVIRQFVTTSRIQPTIIQGINYLHGRGQTSGIDQWRHTRKNKRWIVHKGGKLDHLVPIESQKGPSNIAYGLVNKSIPLKVGKFRQNGRSD